MSCGKLLAPDQWWHFCGETDMGQTLPVQCTECGGEYKLASPEAQAEHDRKKAEWAAKSNEDKFFGAYLGTGTSKTIEHSIGMQPKWFMVKQEDGTIKTVENPDYVESPPAEPDEKDDDDNPFDDWRQGYAGYWRIPAPFGATMLQCKRKPSWLKRMAVKWATGWTWEDYE